MEKQGNTQWKAEIFLRDLGNNPQTNNFYGDAQRFFFFKLKVKSSLINKDYKPNTHCAYNSKIQKSELTKCHCQETGVSNFKEIHCKPEFTSYFTSQLKKTSN